MTEVRFDHLLRLCTPVGVFEHAKGAVPRPEHGYCLDDVGRALVVIGREADPPAELREVAGTCLVFTLAALAPGLGMRNRRSATGRWTDEPSVADHWGRAVWGLSQLAVSHWCDEPMRREAMDALRPAMDMRCGFRRSMAHAAIGAADVLAASPGGEVADPARRLLEDSRRVLAGQPSAPSMPWPEPRLTYANPLIPEAHLAIGSALGDDEQVERGLAMLEWLAALQVRDGHLSPVPTRGWAPGDRLPSFDQQPIEAWSFAEAANRAWRITGDRRWRQLLAMAEAWFLGDNDAGVALYDPATGAGCDGLQRTGVNANQGAESTLAALGTLQLARSVAGVAA